MPLYHDYFYFNHYQRIRVTPDQAKSKSLLMEWKVPKNSVECPYTIMFYGAFFCEVITGL